MYVCLFGSVCLARIDDNQFWWIRPPTPIENTHPKDRVGSCHVMPNKEEAVGFIDVKIGPGLSVGTERFLKSCRRGGRAQPRISVHVRSTQAGFSDHAERVVLLEKKLSCRIEAKSAGGVAVAHLLRA